MLGDGRDRTSVMEQIQDLMGEHASEWKLHSCMNGYGYDIYFATFRLESIGSYVALASIITPSSPELGWMIVDQADTEFGATTAITSMKVKFSDKRRTAAQIEALERPLALFPPTDLMSRVGVDDL